MDLYFKLKVIFDYILPIIIFAIIVVPIILIVCYFTIKSSIREHRIYKHFMKLGYERYLIGVTSVGGGEYWGWRKDGTIIDDRNLDMLTVKEIKKTYK